MSRRRRLVAAASACLATMTSCSGTSPSAPGAALSESSALAHEVEQIIGAWYGSDEIGGAVAAVGLPDGSIHAAAIGERAPGEPARVDDVMRIGSITKAFTAAMVLRLVDQGVLSLDDPVADHLPELGLPRSVVIRDLLGHTSGVSDPDRTELIARFRADPRHEYGIEELLAITRLPAEEAPSEATFAYANANYHVVGLLVERLTGRDAVGLLRSEVIEPAGLDHTYMAGFEPVPEPIVAGYADVDGDGAVDATPVPYAAVETYGWVAGALVATPADLVGFARAVFGGDLLSDRATAALTESAGVEGYGLGVLRVDTAWGHDGSAPGFTTRLLHDPESRVTAVLFTNCPECATGGEDPWAVTEQLLNAASSRR